MLKEVVDLCHEGVWVFSPMDFQHAGAGFWVQIRVKERTDLHLSVLQHGSCLAWENQGKSYLALVQSLHW